MGGQTTSSPRFMGCCRCLGIIVIYFCYGNGGYFLLILGCDSILGYLVGGCVVHLPILVCCLGEGPTCITTRKQCSN